MKSSQVRDLARRYATGKLSQENYRSQRRSLIDSITGGGVLLAYRNDERAKVRPRLNTKLLGLTVAILIAAGIGVVFILKHSGPARAQGGTQAVEAQPTAAPPPSPGPALVRTFVEADDWTDGSLQTFTRRWERLDAGEQAKAKDSLMYPRLMSEVRQQVDSEKAVSGPGGSDPHLVQLQKLAKTLGASAGP